MKRWKSGASTPRRNPCSLSTACWILWGKNWAQRERRHALDTGRNHLGGALAPLALSTQRDYRDIGLDDLPDTLTAGANPGGRRRGGEKDSTHHAGIQNPAAPNDPDTHSLSH